MNNGFMMVSLFSKDVSKLPTVNHVGDIIRIHRANISQYKQNKTFSANIELGTSWIIFKGAQSPSEGAAGAEPSASQASGANIQNFLAGSEAEDPANEKTKEGKIHPYNTSKENYNLSYVDD